MNVGFLRTWHALIALAAIAAFSAWHVFDQRPFGDRSDENVTFLLTTGWFAVAAYVVLALYAARRAAHRLRLSPEFGWQARLSQLERAQSQLTELDNRIRRREVGGKADIQRAARAILKANDVQRVLRVDVRRAAGGLGQLHLEVLPRDVLGRMVCWLSAHAWYGIAAAVLVWFHGGGRCATTMGLLLNVLSYFVIATGLLGGIFWVFGPTWLTRAERELSVEKAFALRDHFRRKLTEVQGELDALPERRQQAATDVATRQQQRDQAKAQASDPKDKKQKKALKDAESALKKALAAQQELVQLAESLPRDLEVLNGQRKLVEREAARLGRYRTLLRGWRLVHVPCSALLLALVAVHVLSIYYY